MWQAHTKSDIPSTRAKRAHSFLTSAGRSLMCQLLPLPLVAQAVEAAVNALHELGAGLAALLRRHELLGLVLSAGLEHLIQADPGLEGLVDGPSRFDLLRCHVGLLS